jgi:CHAT domain-containing protein
MQDERQQAYLELVQQLLICERGQEPEILAAHENLVDEGLVTTALAVAEMLEKREGSEAAGTVEWLRGFARDLVQGLGLGNGGDDPQAHLEFLITVLRAVSDSDGDPKVVYPLLKQNLGLLDESLIGLLQGWVRETFAGLELEQVRSIAMVIGNFGNLVQQFPLGNKAVNMDLAIACYEILSTVFTIETDPEMWAMTQNNRSLAYSESINGDRAENIELAITGYDAALQVRTYEDFPIQWAGTQNNRANAYKNRIKGDRAENLELAIAGYDSSLKVYTREDFPIQWATTQNNRANAYSERIKGDQAENIELAITGYNAALQVRTYEDFPIQWAGTQNNCASAHNARIKGNRAENIELAIAGYNASLQVYTREDFPIDWAMTQNNLSLAYSDRVKGNRAENIELAITGYDVSLQVRTRKNFPIDWAMTQNNRASAYSERIKGDRAENIELAIAGYNASLQVYTRKDFPIDWATTQNNRSLAYSKRIKGKRAENIELAITGYDSSLQVRTYEDFPIQWAGTQNNRANAYHDRIKGDRAENIELAIAGYDSSLQVYTREDFPIDWAMAQNNRANAYKNRIKGDRAENIELAIAGYNAALQVRTYEDFPMDWAMTQNNRANAYHDRIKGDRAENIELAIAGYNAALQVRTYEDFPMDWAMTQNNRANAYRERINGDQVENIELAIAGYDASLQVRTRQNFPIDWATTQNNRANAYVESIKGDRAENIELAIAGYDSSLQVRTYEDFPIQWAGTQNNRANAYKNRIKGDRAENIELAIAGYDSSLRIYNHVNFPKECRITSRSLGNIHFDRQDWEAANSAYKNALAAAEILYQSCLLLDSKTSELTENADLSHRMTYALTQIGNLTKAIETIESSRARSLTESLDRDRADLDRLQQQNPTLYNQYKEINRQLRNLEAQQRDRMVSKNRHEITPEVLRDEATKLRQNLDDRVQEIRQIPGHEEFLALSTFAEIQRATQPNRPLVYLITTSAGGLALILQPDRVEPVWLDDFTTDKLTELLETWFNAYARSKQDRPAWLDTIDTITGKLWDPLMAEIVQKLQEMKCDCATLIPTGYLSFFPLHAAWTKDDSKPTGRRYALDDIQITYAPNAKSLTAAQQIADRTTHRNILAIDNPTEDLANAALEIECAIANFSDPTVLRHTAATVAAVRSQLSTASIVHFCCHGRAELTDPLNSGLLMSDGLLTLKDIFALNLGDRDGIRLAILAACETGMIGTKNADEAISLPTGLLQAGVAAVISSLWSVSDNSTALMIAKFYDLWHNEQIRPLDRALHQAQIWLRDTTNEEKIQELEASLPEFDNSQHFPEIVARDLYNKLALNEPEDLDFAHPFHWAGFSYTGV